MRCPIGDGEDVVGDGILVPHRGDGMLHAHHRCNLVHAVATGATVIVAIAHRIMMIIAQFFIEGDGVGLGPYHRLIHPKIRDLRR